MQSSNILIICIIAIVALVLLYLYIKYSYPLSQIHYIVSIVFVILVLGIIILYYKNTIPCDIPQCPVCKDCPTSPPCPVCKDCPTSPPCEKCFPSTAMYFIGFFTIPFILLIIGLIFYFSLKYAKRNIKKNQIKNAFIPTYSKDIEMTEINDSNPFSSDY
jgi:hypothetical protein